VKSSSAAFQGRQLRLVPATDAPHLLDGPLAWSLKMWGESNEAFSPEDWIAFYKNVLKSNYSIWDEQLPAKELLFLAIRTINGEDEVVAAIGLSDFDDLEEFRHFKPWFCAFIVKEEVRGLGIGNHVLKLMEDRARRYRIEEIYLWTEDQEAFYRKRGYITIEHLEKPGRLLNIMKKNL